MPLRKRFSLCLFLCSALVLIEACSKKETQSENLSSGAVFEASKKALEVSKVSLAKGENYLGGEVYYVEGTLTNNGDRTIYRVTLTFVFKDTLNQAVLRETRKAIEYKSGRGLDAQKSVRFQVAFDHLPTDWNHFIPEVEVSNVALR